MQIIMDNYLIIIIVGLFFVFALIGYLVDLIKNQKQDRNISEIKPIEVPPVELTKIKNESVNNEISNKEINDNKDDLLEDYNKNEKKM
mgnify:FL=1